MNQKYPLFIGQAAMVECENCGRRFAGDRLSVHQKSCTADNPAKPAPGWKKGAQ